MSELESPEKIAKDIAKLERNLNQVADITFEGKERRSTIGLSTTGTIQNIILKKEI